jgi:hypothetical protein
MRPAIWKSAGATMKKTLYSLMIACSTAMLLPVTAHAQFRDGPFPGNARFSDENRWGQGEKRGLCRQSIALAGVEDDMDRRIRDIVRNANDSAGGRRRSRDTSSRAYQDALDGALSDAKGPILDQLLDSCTTTFSVSELRGINNFYASPAGQAWLRKGRTSIMPAMERAIGEIQPSIGEEVERRYCQRMGC